MNSQNTYQKLANLSKKAKLLSGISSLLSWDQETYMPKGAFAIRGEQQELLAGITHQVKTSKAFSKLLGSMIDLKSGEILANDLSKRQKSALIQWRRDWKVETALPKRFVEEFAQKTSTAFSIWEEAKKGNSFKTFQPHLETIVKLCQRKAHLIGYTSHPYDALLDLYEPGMTTEKVSALFSSLKKRLVALIKKIAAKKPIDATFLTQGFTKDKQIAFAQEILKEMGYDMQFGRIDFSAHPFSSAAHPTDSRITTSQQSHSIEGHLLTLLHETGHALYEMGLPEADYGTPLCEAISYGMHESQSRWWETKIGLSKPFWDFYFPKLVNAFPSLKEVSFQQFYGAINKVEPTCIRVEADEATYGLHVILRFEIEKKLIEGSLKVKEIPGVWNEMMEELLGIRPKNDAEGCLQDVHWSMGGFGYFPSYTLGNLFASHLFLGFEKEHPEWKDKVRKGSLLFISDWLKDKVHKFGRQYSSHEILEKATGMPFTEQPFIDYLEKKYTKIYDL